MEESSLTQPRDPQVVVGKTPLHTKREELNHPKTSSVKVAVKFLGRKMVLVEIKTGWWIWATDKAQLALQESCALRVEPRDAD